ncbi:ribosome biogenesis protein NOP53-like [Argonauta hians]
MIMEDLKSKRKRLHVAKNKKKAWRKTDIKDVEEYLEDVRHQERTGGLLAEKPDKNLFFVDKTSKRPKKITAAERRRLRQNDKKPLKCHSQLYKKGGVACPIKPNRVVKKVSDFQVEKLLKGKLSKKEEQIINDRVKSIEEFKDKKAQYFSDRVVDYDLWNEPEKMPDQTKNEEADLHYLKYTNNLRVKIPRLYLKKRSEVPAVEAPHAGSSYNPVFEDHQDLLQIATKDECRYNKMQDKLRRALDAMFPSAEEAPTIKSWIKEMSAGLQNEEEEEKKTAVEAGEEGEEEDKAAVTKQPKPKTKKQHRKARERKMEERTRKDKKMLKQREFDVYRIRSMKKEMNKFDKEVERKKLARDQKNKELDKTRTKRLGKTSFVKPDLEVKLSDELPDSLLHIVPEGNLLEDRFSSLQRRNILEPRNVFKKATQKKYKRKLFVKRAYKEDPE